MLSYLFQGLILCAVPFVRATRGLPYDFPYGSLEPAPFHLSVDEDFVEQTLEKARSYRPSIDLLDSAASNPGWIEGPPSANLAALRDYWADEFDWARIEEEINGNFSHYAVTIQDIPGYSDDVHLHFIHEPSEVEGAIPLILLHGWPSTSLEWRNVIHELAAPLNPDAPAFHVVAPDLPGFGFSPAPTYSGYGPHEISHSVHKLMQVLGYEKYGVISTDLGWWTAVFLVNLYPEAVTGHFSDFWIIEPTAEDRDRYNNNLTTAEENEWIDAVTYWFENHNSYSLVHQGAVLAVGQALSDTPVGFAGWMWHLVHAVSNGFEYVFEDLIRDAFLLYMPGVFGNIRLYKEIFQDTVRLPVSNVTTGVTIWNMGDGPYPEMEGFVVPREWTERIANVVYYTTHDIGGHFPAISVPDLWLAEVRAFFGGSTN